MYRASSLTWLPVSSDFGLLGALASFPHLEWGWQWYLPHHVERSPPVTLGNVLVPAPRAPCAWDVSSQSYASLVQDSFLTSFPHLMIPEPDSFLYRVSHCLAFQCCCSEECAGLKSIFLTSIPADLGVWWTPLEGLPGSCTPKLRQRHTAYR